MTKIKNLDELLNADNINHSIIELDNFIGDICDYGDEMDKLSEPQKLFYINQNLEREVNNGGFNQFFINSSGNYAHETIISLKAIGADKTAAIVQKAIDQFPDKIVPKDREERTGIVEQIEEVADKIWSELNKSFFKYEDDLNTLNIEYIKKHKDSF
ncbi:MAG: DMP19 family protein [Bacteroidota bacterium]